MMRFISTWGTSFVSPEQKLFFYPMKPKRVFESSWKEVTLTTYRKSYALNPQNYKNSEPQAVSTSRLRGAPTFS